MTKVDEFPTIAPPPGGRIWPLSVAAYHALGEMGLIPLHTELLYGVVYTKMPKSPFHAYLIQFFMELQPALPPGHLLRIEQPLTLIDSEPEPDISIVRGRKEDFRHAHPETAELVVEVCITSHDYDRSKLRAYASAGVKECWLVLGPEQQVEVYRQPIEGQFTEHKTYDELGMLRCAAVELELNLEQVFAS